MSDWTGTRGRVDSWGVTPEQKQRLLRILNNVICRVFTALLCAVGTGTCAYIVYDAADLAALFGVTLGWLQAIGLAFLSDIFIGCNDPPRV